MYVRGYLLWEAVAAFWTPTLVANLDLNLVLLVRPTVRPFAPPDLRISSSVFYDFFMKLDSHEVRKVTNHEF